MAEEAIELIAKIPDSIERGSYVKRLSEELQIEEIFIRERLALICKKKDRVRRQRVLPGENKKRVTAEESLIQILITYPEIAKKLVGKFDPEDFTDPLLGAIAHYILLSMQSGEEFDVNKIITTLKDENAIALIARYSLMDVEYDDIEKAANDCLDRIKEDRLRKHLTKLQQIIKERGTSEMTDELNVLLRKKQELLKGKGNPKNPMIFGD